MVEFAIEDGKLHIHVKGADQLWALRSSLEIPLAHIAGVRPADPSIMDSWWKGFKLVGTNLPGVIAAGTFYQHSKKVFWDVHHGENAIVIDLHDERYSQLIVEVEDPNSAIGLVLDALKSK